MRILLVFLLAWVAVDLAYAHPILFMAGTMIPLGTLALIAAVKADRLAIREWRAGLAERIRQLERNLGIRP